MKAETPQTIDRYAEGLPRPVRSAHRRVLARVSGLSPRPHDLGREFNPLKNPALRVLPDTS